MVVPGKGKLVITGLLEKGMEESGQAAMSYVRSRLDRLGLEKDSFQKLDVHVHFPDFVRKDGPSAGVTMVTAIVSALMKVPVHRDLAMTGEITLRGRVMPIGGLKEKLLAAHRGGIRTVVLPKENRKDLRDVPRRVLKALRLCLVEHVDDVLREALVLPDADSVFGPRGDGVLVYLDGEPVVPGATPAPAPLPLPAQAPGEQPGA
jgi:ATP-dependent Lon protease